MEKNRQRREKQAGRWLVEVCCCFGFSEHMGEGRERCSWLDVVKQLLEKVWIWKPWSRWDTSLVSLDDREGGNECRKSNPSYSWVSSVRQRLSYRAGSRAGCCCPTTSGWPWLLLWQGRRSSSLPAMVFLCCSGNAPRRQYLALNILKTALIMSGGCYNMSTRLFSQNPMF